MSELLVAETKDARTARKERLESRRELYYQMERLCYDEQQKLRKEINEIEDAEGIEEEREWKASMAR